MNSLSRSIAAYLFLCPLSWVAAQEAITSAAQVQALSIEAAELARPVRIEGVMTYIDVANGQAYVQDASGGVSLKLTPDDTLPPGLQSGSAVIVEGVTARGQFLPRIVGGPTGLQIQILGQGALPPAKSVNGPQLTLPDMDSQWIEIRGVVRPPPAPYGGAVLALEAEGRTFFAYVPGTAEKRSLPPSLLGVRVKVRAVAGTFVNDRRQMTRRVLLLPSIDSITAEETLVVDDPFQRPLTAFDELLRAHTPGASERAKVRGTALLALPNEGLFIREENGGGLWLQTSQGFSGPAVTPGDTVEAVGWPEAENFRPDLRGVVFRVVAHGPPVVPIRTTARDLLSARHHGDLVQLEGTLVGLYVDPVSTRLLLSHDEVFFEARVPVAVTRVPLPEWVRDTRLRITGVCENIPGEAVSSPQTSQTFFIRVSTIGDVVVLSSPSWWTSQRLFWVLGGTLGCAVLAGSWAIALRRRVAIQTKVIEAQVHRSGVQEERQRLARELHDSLEQEMTGVGLQLETALARVMSDPDAAKVSVERARRLLHRAQRETRETIWDLRSSATDPGVLPGLLREVLGPIAEAVGAGLEVSFSENVPDGLPGTLMHHLVRIAHEAVANAAKHGHPKSILVSLDFIDNEIHLLVRDDGCGFLQETAPGARQGHFGLTGMGERAAKTDGKLTITSAPGQGTTVRFTAPLLLNHAS